MRRLFGAPVAMAFLVGCQAVTSTLRPPLAGEGEVYIYLQPLPKENGRLSFVPESAAVLLPDGSAAPLTVASGDPFVVGSASQRLLAWGRVNPGTYTRLAIKVKKATLTRPEGTAELLVAEEPAQVEAQVLVTHGKATVLWLTLDAERSFASTATFNPAFTAAPPSPSLPGLVGWASGPDEENVTVFDKHTRQVGQIIEISGDPQGLALDEVALKGYVALNGRDEVAVLDLLTGAAVSPIRLRPGDRPTDLGLTPDRLLLLSVNTGSSTVSFLDPVSQTEASRVQVGYEPRYLLIDRSGKRAYVCNRVSSSITVIDIVNRAVVGNIATEAAPVAAQLNRDGTRIYVVHAGSPFLTVYNVPAYTLATRAFVGLGAASLKIDPLTDLVYLGRSNTDQIDVYEPTTVLAVGSVEVPGGVSYMTIDDVENTLLAAVTGRSEVAVVDLTSRRVLAIVDGAGEPFRIALTGARR